MNRAILQLREVITGWTCGMLFAGYTAVLLGAGGAARGAAFALVDASVERLIIVNHKLERAQRLAADLQQESNCQVFCLNDPDFLIPHPTSIIINATPVGTHAADKQGNREAKNGSLLPAEVLARFAPDTVVFDMVYPFERKTPAAEAWG